MSNANRIRIANLEKRVADLEAGVSWRLYGAYLIDLQGNKRGYMDLDYNGKATFDPGKGDYFGVMVVDRGNRELITVAKFENGTIHAVGGDLITATIDLELL